MSMTKKIAYRRNAFTLVEMLVVIAIILAIAALAAAFAPRVNDSQNLMRAVDNLQQWLLTAKMRAKRDGLATGIRFVQAAGDAGLTYSQVQYIQQPDPLTGGWMSSTGLVGGQLTFAGQATPGVETVTFQGVDFTLGGLTLPNQWLVQPGDYLEIRDGGVYIIGQVAPLSPTNMLVLGLPNTTNPYANPPTPGPYDLALSIPATSATTNYRILRQPRILIGEEPMALPNNYAVNMNFIPQTIIPANTTIPWSNVVVGASGNYEILFSPTGAVVGSNAGSGMIFLTVYDMTMNPFDMNNIGIVAVQCRTGFMGAYGAAAGAGLAGYNPFYLAQIGRESGM